MHLDMQLSLICFFKFQSNRSDMHHELTMNAICEIGILILTNPYRIQFLLITCAACDNKATLLLALVSLLTHEPTFCPKETNGQFYAYYTTHYTIN
jgi:hypothetical protein